MRRVLFLLFCGILYASAASAQMDTEFWFAAPRVPSFGLPIRLVVSTGAAPANVSITQPATGATMPAINVMVAANSVHREDLTAHAAILQSHPAATALPYGLKIVSDVPVLVYYEVQGLNGTNWVNAEVYTLKGTGGMGTSFLIPSQNYVGNTSAYGGEGRNSFDIVATEDNTTVTITPTSDLAGGHAAGMSFNITLNTGQVWSASALNRGATSHLPGSLVVADKPISITVKDDVLEGTTTTPGVSYGICVDQVGDQIIPASSLGTEYIAMNGRLTAPGDQLFVTALQNNTEIYRDGGATPVATINAGQTHRMAAVTTVGQVSSYIRTTQPVTVWQLTGMGCEMGATQLPQIECSGSSSVIYSRTMPWNLYVNLMVTSGGQNNFSINGVALTGATWTAVPGTANQWFTTQLDLSSQVPQGTVLTVNNTSHLFHMSVLDGAGTNSTSYGYFSNYNRVAAEASASSNVVCVGDSIHLYALTVRNGMYSWSGPGGFSSTDQNPVLPGTDPSLQTGWYHLSVSSTTGGGICGSGKDSVYINIHFPPDVDLGRDLSVCLDSLVLAPGTTSAGASYLWSDGSTDDSLKVYSSDTYWLEVTDTNGCVSADTIQVDLGVAIEADLGPDIALCDRDLPVTLKTSQPAGTRYLWSNGLSDSFLIVTYGGRHWVRIEREGCVDSDTIDVMSIATPHLYIGEDSTICTQFPLRIGGEVAGGVYSWNTGAPTPYIHVSETGDYILSADVDGCVVHDTVSIVAMPPPDVDLGFDGDICRDQIVVLDAGISGNNYYEWSTGERTSSISVNSEGTYSVRVTTEYLCVGSDTIVFSFYPDPIVHLGPDTTVCEETPIRLHAWGVNVDSLLWSDGSVGESLLVRYGGDYIVTGINKCGMASDTTTLSQIFCDIWVPNAFTPDGDGLNDVFRVLGNIGRLDGFTFSVFNRWGERVFVTQDKLQGWDGVHKGMPSQLGTYVYLLQYSIEGRPYTQHGNFHLLR